MHCRKEMIALYEDRVPRSCPTCGLGPCIKENIVRGLKYKKVTETAIEPTKSYESAAAFDLYADETVTIWQGKPVSIKTGIAMEIPEGFSGFIWPRSGLSVKHGVDVLAGVIDSDYRGEIMVCLTFDSVIELYYTSDGDKYEIDHKVMTVKKGSKIAQIAIQETPEFVFLEVDELNNSERGEKGFGSSGV